MDSFDCISILTEQNYTEYEVVLEPDLYLILYYLERLAHNMRTIQLGFRQAQPKKCDYEIDSPNQRRSGLPGGAYYNSGRDFCVVKWPLKLQTVLHTKT